MGYIEGEDRKQTVLFPEVLDDYISEENAVRFEENAVRFIDVFIATDALLCDLGCKSCELRFRCSINKKGIRSIKRWVDEAIMEAMARRLAEHPEKVELRKCLAEHPFGTIKRAMNQGYFLMRGLSKVGTETSLTMLAYNLKQVMNILGMRKMMDALT